MCTRCEELLLLKANFPLLLLRRFFVEKIKGVSGEVMGKNVLGNVFN